MSRVVDDEELQVREEKMKEMLVEAKDRAERGIEDANPADYEPIIDRIDLEKGYVPGNVQIVCGLAYRMRHGLYDFASGPPDWEEFFKDQVEDKDRLIEKAKGTYNEMLKRWSN